MNEKTLLGLVLVLMLVTGGAFAGCGSSDSTGTETSSSTGAETSGDEGTGGSGESPAEAEAAVADVFDAFVNDATSGNGKEACALMTPAFEKEWEEIQLEIEGTPAEAACPNSVLETIYAKFPFKLEDVSVSGTEAEAKTFGKIEGTWEEQWEVEFEEADGEWLISGGLIGG